MNFLRFVSRRLYLFLFLLRKHFLRNYLSSAGLLLSLIIVAFTLGIIRPWKQLVYERFSHSLPAEIIQVRAPQKSQPPSLVSLFAKPKDFSLGIQARQIRQIGKFEEIDNIMLSQILQISSTGTIDSPLLGSVNARSELLIQGLSPQLVTPFLKGGRSFRPYRDENGQLLVPLVIPETFAEIAYAYAAISGLPAISREQLIGLRLKIAVGDSFLHRRRGKIQTYTGVIRGFVPASMLTAIGAPLDWVKELHRQEKMTRAANSYDQIFIRVKTAADLPEVKEKIQKMGLTFPVLTNKYSALYNMLDKLDLVVKGIALLLFVLSAIAMANSFMLLSLEKKYEFGLYLVFGASPVFIWLLMFFEGAFYGFLHASLGLYLAEQIFHNLQNHLAELPWLNLIPLSELSFQISWPEKTALVSAVSVFAGLAALIPSLFLMGVKTIHLVKKD